MTESRIQSVLVSWRYSAPSILTMHLVESCRFGKRKPDPSIFNEALKKLGVKAEEAVFLDDQGRNVKAARELGISTILVKDTSAALKELQEITGIDVSQEAKPLSVHPERVPHSYATTRSGVRFHYVDIGSGPPVIFCHGFPESWYEWKSQIPAVAAAGFRVIAMDMKGYGESSNPPEIEEYIMERICKVVNLTRAHIEDSGHWAPLEQPKKLNEILVDWLDKVHKGSNRPIFPSSL